MTATGVSEWSDALPGGGGALSLLVTRCPSFKQMDFAALEEGRLSLSAADLEARRLRYSRIAAVASSTAAEAPTATPTMRAMGGAVLVAPASRVEYTVLVEDWGTAVLLLGVLVLGELGGLLRGASALAGGSYSAQGKTRSAMSTRCGQAASLTALVW